MFLKPTFFCISWFLLFGVCWANSDLMLMRNKMLDIDFFNFVADGHKNERLNAVAYKNFLHIVLQQFQHGTLDTSVIKNEVSLETTAMTALSKILGLPCNTRWLRELQRFCRILYVAHPVKCIGKICDSCRGNLTFLLNSRVGVKNLLHAAVLRQQLITSSRRVLLLFLACGTFLYGGIIAFFGGAIFSYHRMRDQPFVAADVPPRETSCDVRQRCDVLEQRCEALKGMLEKVSADNEKLATFLKTKQDADYEAQKNLKAEFDELSGRVTQGCDAGAKIIEYVKSQSVQLEKSIVDLEQKVGVAAP